MPPPDWGYRLAAAQRVYRRREGIGILILPLFYVFLNLLFVRHVRGLLRINRCHEMAPRVGRNLIARYQLGVSATLDVRPAAVSALQTLGHAEVAGTRLAAKLLKSGTSPSVAPATKGTKRLLVRLDLRLGIACDT